MSVKTSVSKVYRPFKCGVCKFLRACTKIGRQAKRCKLFKQASLIDLKKRIGDVNARKQ